MKKILLFFAALLVSVCSAMAQPAWNSIGSLKVSPALADGDFADGTVFYQIQNKTSGYLSTASMKDGSLNFTTSGITADAARWAILGNATTGYQFINKATKEYIAMAKFTVTNQENQTNANSSSMVSDGTDANTYFDLAAHRGVAGYFVITAHDNHYFYWNQLTTLGYWYSGEGYEYGYWGWKNYGGTANSNVGDDGASFKFNEVETITLNTFTFELPAGVSVTYGGNTYSNGMTVSVKGAIAASDVTITTEAPKGYHYVVTVDGTGLKVIVTLELNALSGLADIIEGKLYTLTSVDRGSFVYSSSYAADYISGSKRAGYTVSDTDPNCQFAFIQHDGKTYLWSKGAQKFVEYASDGLKVTENVPERDLTLLASTGGAKETHPVVLDIDKQHQCNMSSDQGYGILTNWNNTADNGNMLRILPVANLTSEELAAIYAIWEIPNYDVVYNYMLDGELWKTETRSLPLGSTVTAPTLFAYVSESHNDLQTVTTGENVVEVTCTPTALPFTVTTDESAPVLGKLYVHSNQTRIAYVDADGKGMDSGATGGKGNMPAEFGNGYLWYITGNIKEGFKLHNLSMDGTLHATAGQATMSGEASDVFELHYGTHGTDSWNFKTVLGFDQTNDQIFALYSKERGEYLNAQNGLKYWGAADNGSTFHFEPVEDVLVTIGSKGYATLYREYPLAVPADVKAYVLSENEDGETLHAEEVTTIPAGTGVVLQGAENIYTFKVARSEAAESCLSGVYVDTDVEAKSIFVFNVENGVPGFYCYNNTTIDAHKAYYAPSTSGSNFRIVFDGELTGITGIEAQGAAQPVFDLQGRRVINAKSGLYIVGGKKVIK